jgi:flagellar biosynthesis/type III secretory pathway protein FliH
MAVVLKSGSSSSCETPGRSAGLAGFNLSDLASEGRQQLEECRQQAEQMLADAQQQADRIRRDAEQQGYQDGLQRGLEEAETKIQESAEQRARTGLDLVRSAVAQLHDEHQAWMTQYAQAITEVSLAATERIVRSQLQREPQLLVQWAEDAVRSARSACQLTVAVNPETLALLGQSLDEMLAAPDLPEQSHVLPDESVGPTEVVIRQTGGEIRAGLIAQLRRLEELLP